MISVIIPIYNTEKYLGRCIDSVLNSSYQNFEIILINDGSEDGSAEICKKYLSRDSRIKYYEQKNAGVSVARNRGIEESKGEWIVFVDSDDFISEDFLSTIAKEEYQNYDLLIFDYIRIKKGKKGLKAYFSIFPVLGTYHYEEEDKIFLIEKILNAEQLVEKGNTKLISPWAKAYKKSVINQYSIRFPVEIVIGEDTLLNLEYIQNIDSCLYLQKKVYFFEPRSNSATHKFYKDYLKNNIKYRKHMKSILEKSSFFSLVKSAYYNRVLFETVDMLIKGIFNPYSTRSYAENCQLCHEIHSNSIYMEALKYNNQMGRLHRRILLFLFYIECYRIVEMICKFSYRILEKTDRL